MRPWKLLTLALGILLLVIGAEFHIAPDWDIPVSLIMAAMTYLTAPWSIRMLLERRWRLWPLVIFVAWLTVDGSYSIYWYFRNPGVLAFMRDANFLPSLCLYALCGVFWMYRGSMRQAIEALNKATTR